MLAADPDICRWRALRAVEAGLLRLKWLAAATRFQIALVRHDRALKANFNPNQPRVPRGNPDGGQWTDGGGTSRRIRLAGDIPTGDPPEIPKQRPPTSRARTAILKSIARRLGPIGTVIEIGSWLYEYRAKIESYRDPPQTLQELQDAVSSPTAGYQIHHIVERTSAERDGKFPRDIINGPDNLVRIPTMRHEDINGWFKRPNSDYNWQTPREYLRDKKWEERRAVGLKALVENGVLKP